MFKQFAFVVALATVGGARAEPLSLAEAMDKAVKTSPVLAALSTNAEAQSSAEGGAGRLPEPRLALAIQNLPVTGADSWNAARDPMTMQAIGLMQEVPNSAKRRAEVDRAKALSERARAELRLKTLEVRRDTALAWIERFYLERQVVLLDEMRRENVLLEQSANAELSAGRGSVADSLLPKREGAELDDRRDALLAQIAKSKARLRRFVEDAPDEPLTGRAPELAVDATHLRQHVHEHPELAVFEPQTAIAQAELDQAEATRHPDWGVALMYGHRAARFGDMLTVQFTVGLPWLARGHSSAELESRLHARAQVGLERDGMLRDHVAELDADLADYESASRQLERLRLIHKPLAEQQIALRLAQYQAGTGGLKDVLDARRELIELRLREVGMESERAAVAAKLSTIYGGELP